MENAFKENSQEEFNNVLQEAYDEQKSDPSDTSQKKLL